MKYIEKQKKIIKITVKIRKIVAGDKLPDSEHSLGITVSYRLKVIIGYFGRLSTKQVLFEGRR